MVKRADKKSLLDDEFDEEEADTGLGLNSEYARRFEVRCPCPLPTPPKQRRKEQKTNFRSVVARAWSWVCCV